MDHREEHTTVTSIRIPKELKEKLQKIAKKERRTLNAQIIYFLEKAIEKREQ